MEKRRAKQCDFVMYEKPCAVFLADFALQGDRAQADATSLVGNVEHLRGRVEAGDRSARNWRSRCVNFQKCKKQKEEECGN